MKKVKVITSSQAAELVKDNDTIKTMQKINDIIEGWIKENPSQWFWVHDRWGIKNSLCKKKGAKNAKSKNYKK